MGEPGVVEDALATCRPRVLGALIRRHRDPSRCEDAVQEAMAVAARTWTVDGVPERPDAWLAAVAHRRVIDSIRSDAARRRREAAVAAPVVDAGESALDVSELPAPHPLDDTLGLMALCAHPGLSTASQMALTLRFVAGLSTREIAAAFLVPEATMTRRLTRAKATLGEVMRRDRTLGPRDPMEAAPTIRRVLHLIFNEGWAASGGAELQRRALVDEAIRLADLLVDLTGDDPESVGLRALMELHDARHLARTGPDGALIPLAEQDRSLWDREKISAASNRLLEAMGRGSVGPFQLQAAIAALHAEAPSADATDWPQILGLYRVLERVESNPLHTLARVVAECEVLGPERAMASLTELDRSGALDGHHRLEVVRAHLLERLGRRSEAAAVWALAARRSRNQAEARHLRRRAAELGRMAD